MKPYFTNRKIAIEQALRVELITSLLIKHHVGISITYSNTKALDNKSSSLSLKSKIDLLLDTSKIDKITYGEINQVLAIRNQFAHNYFCNDFMDLSKYIDGIDKFLITYSNQKENNEDNLKVCFQKLCKAIMDKLKVEFEKIVSDYKNKVDRGNKELVKMFLPFYKHYKIKRIKNQRIITKKLIEFLQLEQLKGLDETTNNRMRKHLEMLLKENPKLIG